MEQMTLQRTKSQEELFKLQQELDRVEGLEKKEADSVPGGVVTSEETGSSWNQYSKGETVFDGVWNLGIWGYRAVTGSTKENEEKVEEIVHHDDKSTAQKLAALVLSKMDVKCNVGQTAVLFAPHFGSGKPFEMYLPYGMDSDAFAMAIERGDALVIGKYRDFLETFSDVLRDHLLPMMSREEVSLERKVFELLRLLELSDSEECTTTVYGALFECFQALPKVQKTELMGTHFPQVDDVEGMLRDGKDVSLFKTMLKGLEMTEERRAIMEWSCIEAMQDYAQKNQPAAVVWFYNSLGPKAKAHLAEFEKKAMPQMSNFARASIPGEDSFTYFEGDAAVGVTAKKALKAITSEGFEAFQKALNA